jgi:predicted alpha/beta hydrolase family esterase
VTATLLIVPGLRDHVEAHWQTRLAAIDRVATLAADWGSTLIDLGEVGHLNPASGHGPWPAGDVLMDALLATAPVSPCSRSS